MGEHVCWIKKQQDSFSEIKTGKMEAKRMVSVRKILLGAKKYMNRSSTRSHQIRRLYLMKVSKSFVDRHRVKIIRFSLF